MFASVIVPARDAAQTLPRLLAGIAAQRVEGEVELIVVDDGSADDTARIAAASGARVVSIRPSVGPGAARNRGVATASGAALAFIDADCFPTPDWLAAGVRALERAELVQGRVEPDPSALRGPFDRTLWVTHQRGLFQSANLFVGRDLFERVGGFDDGLMALAGAHFGEDVVFGWRARRQGARAAFCAEALAHHHVLARGAAGFMCERRRDGLFPALAREVPELREHFFYRRWFLSRRSASFALAVAGGIVAGTVRSRLAGLAACAPYVALLARDVRAAGPRVAAVYCVADAITFGSLARSSARARTLVL